MVFLVVDIDSYDLLLGLDFLMKIGAMVDVEKGVIQVQNGPSVTMEVMFFNVVNMMQLIMKLKEVALTIKQPKFGTSTYERSRNP